MAVTVRPLAQFQLDPQCVTEDGGPLGIPAYDEYFGLTFDHSWYRHGNGYKTDGRRTVGIKQVTVSENTTFTFSATLDASTLPMQLGDESWYSEVLDFFVGDNLVTPEAQASLIGCGTKNFSVTIPPGTWMMVWMVYRRIVYPPYETWDEQPDEAGSGECTIYDIDPIEPPTLTLDWLNWNPIQADIASPATLSIFPIDDFDTVQDLSGNVLWDTMTASVKKLATLEPAMLTLSGIDPSITAKVDLESATIALASLPPFSQWVIPAERLPFTREIYTLTLTGEPDGLDDLTLPMSSFTSSLKDSGAPYTSVVVPNITVYADDINARSNGQLIISHGVQYEDGSRQLEKLIVTNFDSIRLDIGSSSQSGSLRGYRPVSIGGAAEFYIQNVSYKSTTATGQTLLRGEIDRNVAVGQTCIYKDESFVISSITFVVQGSWRYMEVVGG